MFVFKKRKEPIEKDFNIVFPDDRNDTKWYEIEVLRTFHLKNFYKVAYRWLKDNDYFSAETNSYGDKHWETLYYEVYTPKLTYHWIWWRCLKYPRKGAKNKFLRYYLKINFQSLGASKQEMMIDGKKFNANKVNFILRMKAWVQIDPDDVWSKHPIIKYFEKTMIDRWFKPRIDQHKLDLWNDFMDFIRELKQFAKLKTDQPRKRPFLDEETGV